MTLVQGPINPALVRIWAPLLVGTGPPPTRVQRAMVATTTYLEHKYGPLTPGELLACERELVVSALTRLLSADAVFAPCLVGLIEVAVGLELFTVAALLPLIADILRTVQVVA